MEYDTQTYFEENEEQSVKGFTIIDQSEDHEVYQIAEKWNNDNGENKWIQYEVKEAQLLTRVQDGACSVKGRLSDEQYAAVCEKVGAAAPDPKEVIA